MKVSKKFKVAIKLNNEPAYQIAQKAGVDPNVLSKIINGIVSIEPNDERVIKIGTHLGLEPYECFEMDN